MHLLARFLFVLCTLSAMAATPAWACVRMAQTVVVAAAHHSHEALAVAATPVAVAANGSPHTGTAASHCNRCASCVFCACLCVGLVRSTADTWLFPDTSDLLEWTPRPLARLGAAPELKPPRA